MLEKVTNTRIRRWIKDGEAVNITNYDTGTMKRFLSERRVTRMMYSTGIFGVNGCIIRDKDTGVTYAISARTKALLMVV